MKFENLNLDKFKKVKIEKKDNVRGGLYNCDGPSGAMATIGSNGTVSKDGEGGPCDDVN